MQPARATTARTLDPAARQRRDLARQQFQVITETHHFALGVGPAKCAQATPRAFDIGFFADKFFLARDGGKLVLPVVLGRR